MTTTVIRGDLPEAAGLADVWLELRKTLTCARRHRRARRPAASSRRAGTKHTPAEATDEGDPAEPDAPEAASSTEKPGPRRSEHALAEHAAVLGD